MFLLFHSENAISNLILHPFLVRHWIWHEINARNQLRGAQAYKLVYLDTWKSINSRCVLETFVSQSFHGTLSRPYQQWIDATISTKLLDEDFSWSDRSFANRIQTFDSPEWRQVIKVRSICRRVRSTSTSLHSIATLISVLVWILRSGEYSSCIALLCLGFCCSVANIRFQDG